VSGSPIDVVKARLARAMGRELPASMSVQERAVRIVDGLIRDGLVDRSERVDWVRKLIADLER
jgi:hypothetical protein